MTIEVKQLQIRSTVAPEVAQAARGQRSSVDLEGIKDDLLAECRRLIQELLRAERER